MQVAHQIPSAGGGFQINLSPDELGHVHMRLVHGDAASTLYVHADRPETMDLMRRHIGQLEQDLRALGHPQLTLRFSGGGSEQTGQQHAHSGETRINAVAADSQLDPAAPTPAMTHGRAPGAALDHLDLRL